MSTQKSTTLTMNANLNLKWKFLPWTHEIPPWGGIPPSWEPCFRFFIMADNIGLPCRLLKCSCN